MNGRLDRVCVFSDHFIRGKKKMLTNYVKYDTILIVTKKFFITRRNVHGTTNN